MKFLPYRKYSLKIPFSPSRFEQKIIDELIRENQKKGNFFKIQDTIFRGSIESRKFELYRHGFANMSLRPIVKGHILDTEEENESLIEMRIMFHPITNFVLLFWFGFIAIVFIFSLIHSFINGQFNIGIPASIGLFLFGYGITMLTYSEEVKAVKRYFYYKWYTRID